MGLELSRWLSLLSVRSVCSIEMGITQERRVLFRVESQMSGGTSYTFTYDAWDMKLLARHAMRSARIPSLSISY